MASTPPYPFEIVIAQMTPENRKRFDRFSDRLRRREERRPWSVWERLGIVSRWRRPLRLLERMASKLYRLSHPTGAGDAP